MTDAPLRFTFVIGRYGATVLGGAERHARAVAERLAARGHDVRVLTSAASSYATWANDLPVGTTREHGVEIVRHRVARGRAASDDARKWLSSLWPGSVRLAERWLTAQGPLMPDLLARLPREARERDVLVFFQLLTHPTVAGLPVVAGKSVLVPLVHRERGVNTAVARRTLATPSALLVNTEEEAGVITELAGPDVAPMRVVGVGLETPSDPVGPVPDLLQPYLVYMGRAGKLTPLARAWRALASSSHLPALRVQGRPVAWRDVRLVVVGGQSSVSAGLPNVVHTGWVDDAARWAILRGAAALVNPSLYESLSLVLLEAWTVGRPVVVNARCDVTAGLTRTSGGGIVADFDDPMRAAATIAEGLSDEARRDDMGRLGETFARARFDWERVLDAYEQAARRLSPQGR